MGQVLDNINIHAEKPAVGATLMVAGFAPAWWDSAHLSAIYYTLLIIPAAYHVYAWFVVNAAPPMRSLFQRVRNVWTRIWNYF